MLLAQVSAKIGFHWIGCGSSGSSSDAQICNRSDLGQKTEDSTLELPAAEPLREGGLDFLLGDDVFAFMPWMVKPYSRRQFTREERIEHYRISRGKREVENVFRILVFRFGVLLGTMEQRQKGCQRHYLYMCGVVHDRQSTSPRK